MSTSCKKKLGKREKIDMSDEKLRESLDELRSELEQLEAEELQIRERRERLDALISRVEMRLDRPEDTAHHQSLVQDVRQSISEFEVSHPRTTAILNQIMVTLGNMGI